LVNLSSDGFRVDMEEESIVEVGDIVLMATSSGFHRVRVVNVARENGTLQLGLQRLQDLPANAVESHVEAEKKTRRPRGWKDTLAQLAIPMGLAAMILGGIVWTWTTEADPVAAVVNDKFVTPTSDYSRRRRHAQDGDEATSPGDRPKKRISGVVDDNGSSRSLVIAGGRSMDTADGHTPDADGSDASKEVADNRPTEAFQPAASAPTFDPGVDATRSIKAALSMASRENKHVLVEFGGSKCGSCSLLNAAFTQDAEIAPAVQKSFVLVLVDMESNQNLVSRYVQNEMRAGVPFLALLGKDGKVLKRRRTDDLGAGSKLDVGKVKQFLQQWSSG
jgi:hypothetical protein